MSKTYVVFRIYYINKYVRFLDRVVFYKKLTDLFLYMQG